MDAREALLLKFVEDRSYEDIAELTGVGVSALKMRVKRAREQLPEPFPAQVLSRDDDSPPAVEGPLEGRVEGRVALPEHVLTVGAGAHINAEILAKTVGQGTALLERALEWHVARDRTDEALLVYVKRSDGSEQRLGPAHVQPVLRADPVVAPAAPGQGSRAEEGTHRRVQAGADPGRNRRRAGPRP